MSLVGSALVSPPEPVDLAGSASFALVFPLKPPL